MTHPASHAATSVFFHCERACPGAPILLNGQIPLFRLPRDVLDKPVPSPLAQIPSRRLPRNFPEEVGVMEFGLKRARRRQRPIA